MNNNDILRRLRYAFDFNDEKMIEIFALANQKVSRGEVKDYLRKDDDPLLVSLYDEMLATFLNGLITEMRGKKDGPLPVPEKRLNNNLVFRKLKIALNLKDDDVLELLRIADFRFGKHELSALFRKPGHSQYRVCKDQVLRYFLQGIQLRNRKK